MLLEDFELEALAAVHHDWWQKANVYCEQYLDQALEVFRVIAESPARCKTVLLLVEAGLWELNRYYAAVLISEALQNPHRPTAEIIAAARAKAS